MYIYDCLYGKMEFDNLVIKCILSPEMQRLREVRLGNINSLFLTGSSENNRFEHSIGTAYLAQINYEVNHKKTNIDEKKEFILAALFHDLANGPFGHSYEYLQKANGFIPEKNVLSVILGNNQNSIYSKKTRLEPFYAGKYNEIHHIIKNTQTIEHIDNIISGNNVSFSKLISDVIDLDNIDNVFRMAYHMGINFDRKAPVELAKSLICDNNNIYFRETALVYVYEWYRTRKNLYTMLLYNPEDFAAKCMLTEAIDLIIKYKPFTISWNYTDKKLLDIISSSKLISCSERVPVRAKCKVDNEVDYHNEQDIREWFRNYYGIVIPATARIEVNAIDFQKIRFSYLNAIYELEGEQLYRFKNSMYNISDIATRLISGDLYRCISIFDTNVDDTIDLSYEFRHLLEMTINGNIREKGFAESDICLHFIVDKNKTCRSIEVNYYSGERFVVGTNSNKIIIGVFLKSKKYGLTKCKKPSKKVTDCILDIVVQHLTEVGFRKLESIPLYSEVNRIE